MAFKPNIGPGTRIAYVLIGAVLLGLAVFRPGLSLAPAWKYVLMAGGILVAAEGAIGF